MALRVDAVRHEDRPFRQRHAYGDSGAQGGRLVRGQVGLDLGVVATAFLGSVVRLTVRLADSTEVKADLPAHEAAGLGAGVAVRVSLPERPVLVAERI